MSNAQNLISFYRDRSHPPFTQATLARALKVNINTIGRWEKHGVPDSNSLLQLVAVFVKTGAIQDYETAQAFWKTAGRTPMAEPRELRELFINPLLLAPVLTSSTESPPALSSLAGTATAPTGAMWRWLGYGLVALLLVTAVLVVVVRANFSDLAVTSSSSDLMPATPTMNMGRRFFILVDPVPGPGAQLILRTGNGQIIDSDDPLRIDEMVTVSFKVRNDSDRPVKLRQLQAGARVHSDCAKEREAKWSGQSLDFPAVTDLVLQPGQEYEYQQSQTFSESGSYFVEPVFLDEYGRWGGFWPAVCTNFVVTP